MAYDSLVLLVLSRQEAGDVCQGDDRNVVGIAVADETSGFVTGIAVQHACHEIRLIGHDTYADAFDPAKAHYNIFCKFFLNLYEGTLIYDAVNDVMDVITLIAVLWDHVFQRFIEL